jgi:hypothetical protein
LRWIKHLTATRRDEKVAQLISQFGYRPYGVWWAILETVAENFDGKNPSLQYPLNTWANLLSIRGSLLLSVVFQIEVTGLLRATRTGNDLTLTIPNLLKYRDEYSRKSGQDRENVGSKKQIHITDTHTDTDTHKPTERIDVPEWVPIESWKGFVEMRKRIRKPMTPRAEQLAIKTLDKLRSKGNDPEQVLDRSTMACWQGLFELNGRENGNGQGVTETKREREYRLAHEFIRSKQGGATT